MSAAALTGGCFCGAVRYAADGAPFHETLCHCTDCRRAAGAPAVAWFSVPRAGFRFTAGTPKVYRSSERAIRRFCPDCGTQITFEADALPEELDVTTATLDNPDAVPPRDHSHAASRVAWDVLAPTIPVRASGLRSRVNDGRAFLLPQSGRRCLLRQQEADEGNPRRTETVTRSHRDYSEPVFALIRPGCAGPPSPACGRRARPATSR